MKQTIRTCALRLSDASRAARMAFIISDPRRLTATPEACAPCEISLCGGHQLREQAVRLRPANVVEVERLVGGYRSVERQPHGFLDLSIGNQTSIRMCLQRGHRVRWSTSAVARGRGVQTTGESGVKKPPVVAVGKSSVLDLFRPATSYRRVKSLFRRPPSPQPDACLVRRGSFYVNVMSRRL